MTLREGAQASYVGYEEDGRQIGDRCLVLSTEHSSSHVRWVTGSKVGQYDLISNEELVADRPPARFEDEFTLDTYSGRIVNIACKDVLEKRGDRALLRAIEQEGHLRDIRMLASTLVSQLRNAIQTDTSWVENSDDLGQDALAFEGYLMHDIIAEAIKGVDHGPVPSLEDE